MSKRIGKFSHAKLERYKDQHRFEHWYVDNQVYLITARCRDRFPAFASDNAKAVFWDRFEHHAAQAGFVPWITSLMDNHYHTLGYLRTGDALKSMMPNIHGSVAKLVNDILARPDSSGRRHLPFWKDRQGRDYFDGCIRNPIQCRRAYRYILKQSVRHGIVRDHQDYPHTRIRIELERGMKRALELNAFLPHVPYPRYNKPKNPGA